MERVDSEGTEERGEVAEMAAKRGEVAEQLCYNTPMDSDKKIIVRFPPSPTGPFHVGSARTALFNYLFAKKHGGEFVLRIEDTDKERSKKEYEDDIFQSLEWLGLKHDNAEVIRQSQRAEVYKKYLQKLIDEGKAYVAEARENGEGQVIRFKNPNKKIKFNDLIRGDIEFDTTELKDFVIAKSLEEPLYHLAVVVDDFETGVTHIIRGEDGISNTPRQILIQEALGAPRPIYAHLPLMLDTERAKLSKRKHGEKVSIAYYRHQGYLPEAVVNFLAMVGWNPGTEQEIFSMRELIESFDIAKVQKSGAVFNIEKLDWLNREYILRASPAEQFSTFNFQFSISKWRDSEKKDDREFMQKLMGMILDRIHRWGETGEILDSGEFDYLFEKPILDKDKIAWKNQTPENAKENLEKASEILESKEKIMELTEKEGKGNVLWPLRYALSGKEKSPDPFTLIDILGPEESRERARDAITILES